MTQRSSLAAYAVQESDIEDILDPPLTAKDALVCAQIDAGACRTQSDYRRLRAMEEAYGKAYEDAVKRLKAMANR